MSTIVPPPPSGSGLASPDADLPDLDTEVQLHGRGGTDVGDSSGGGSGRRPAALRRLGEGGRFEIGALLGSGATGDVYRARDSVLGATVALKLLRRLDPRSLLQFKTEFRLSRGIVHPNLVQLYELLSHDDRWFLTMELVDGPDFVTWCRSPDRAGGPSGSKEAQGRETSDRVSADLLRDGLTQLSDGLAALHARGALHRDVKPGNALVSAEGRVVLLDFGLVAPSLGAAAGVDEPVVGTPAFMAPEQVDGPATEASDWYGVGVLLFQALTGRLPFGGSTWEMFRAKRAGPPMPPGDLTSGVPEDLESLCLDLLSPDPSLRPTADEIRRRLGCSAKRWSRPRSGRPDPLLTGREKEMEELEYAMEHCRAAERPVAVLVHGPSGMGKTLLADRFRARVRERHPEALVLGGRCFERESVPYKALDHLLDALSEELLRWTDGELAKVLPGDLPFLSRLFPTLRRLEVPSRSGSALRDFREIRDEREQKRRARSALRELFARISRRRLVLVTVDDLQWGDRDSAELLAEILEPRGEATPGALFVLGCYRTEEAEASAPVQALIRAGDRGLELREVGLEELSEEASVRLARACLGTDSPEWAREARAVAKEARGLPFFVVELARHVLEGSRAADPRAPLAVDDLIASRLATLQEEPRHLVEVVATAGRPLELRTAVLAARLGSDAHAAVAALRNARLVRLRTARAGEEIETYHDRIRETILRLLPERSRQDLHARLGRTLEAEGRTDAETLAAHARAARESERELRFVVAAAEQASTALAFDRAARLYSRALELAPDREAASGARRRLLKARGDALAYAGRGAEAARTYLEALPGARAAEALDLRRRAAEQLLTSGHVDEGLATLRDVLRTIGMRLPESGLRNLISLLVRRAGLRLRGFGYRERDESQISEEALLHIDACNVVAIGLGNVDPIPAMDFATRHLLLALDAGEPFRVARALAVEAGYSCIGGSRTRRRTAGLVAAAHDLARRVDRPEAEAMAWLADGLAAYVQGFGDLALERFARSETLLRERSTGMTWETDSVVFYRLRLSVLLGRLAVVRRLLPETLRDVRERGDLYAEANLRSAVTWFVRLADDRPDEAEAEIRAVSRRWSHRGFHLQHYLQMVGRAETALYRCEGRAAWVEVESGWPALRRSGFLRIELTFAEAWFLYGRAALAASGEYASAGNGARSRRARRGAQRAVRKLRRSTHRWAPAMRGVLVAGLYTSVDEARLGFEKAAEELGRVGLELHASAARWRAGDLAGAAGAEMRAGARAAMEAEGIRVPERMAGVLAPGPGDPPRRV